jgi:hypothetical protein
MNKIENFFKRNLALLLLLQVAITWSICEYIIIPFVNMPSTIAFFVGCIILMYVISLNWKIFVKFIFVK